MTGTKSKEILITSQHWPLYVSQYLLITNRTAADQPHTQMKYILQDLVPTLACVYIATLCIVIQTKAGINLVECVLFVYICGYSAVVLLVINRY